MTDFSIHFSREEFAQRQDRVRKSMEIQGLYGALLFKIEDMYWLTGYDSDGFSIFGCMFIGTDGQLTHLARPADLGNASYSSICEDVRTAPDSQNTTRAEQIKEMLTSLGMQGKRIGIQVDTMGLTPRLFLQIQEEFKNWCNLIIVPDFIRELRLVKSPQELTYIRKAGEIAVLTACGYTMGAAWPPTWMEQPMIFEGNPIVLEENMSFFTHMILNDRETGLSMAVAEQAIITGGAPEIITHAPRTPIIKG